MMNNLSKLKDLIQKAAFFLLMMILLACGGGNNPDQKARDLIPRSQNVSGQKFVSISPENELNFGDGTLSGTGTVRFAEDLGSVDNDYHFHTEFTLEDGGELTLYTYADTNLENGIELRFVRSGNVLQVFGTAEGNTRDWTREFSSVDASGLMSIGADIHNSERPNTHYLFWNALTEMLLYDSGRDGDHGGGPGQGFGQNWGLKLIEATVESIELEDPEHSHD